MTKQRSRPCRVAGQLGEQLVLIVLVQWHKVRFQRRHAIILVSDRTLRWRRATPLPGS